MTEERKNRLIWGVLLFVGALGSASLRNNPALGISPLAVGVIEGLIFACIMAAVRVSDWKMAAGIAVITPLFLWAQRFLDGYMVPAEMAVNLTMVGCMLLAMKKRQYWIGVMLLAVPAYVVLLLGGTVAISLVKNENLIRSVIIAWNMDVYSGLSILGAALVCAPYEKKETR